MWSPLITITLRTRCDPWTILDRLTTQQNNETITICRSQHTVYLSGDSPSPWYDIQLRSDFHPCDHQYPLCPSCDHCYRHTIPTAPYESLSDQQGLWLSHVSIVHCSPSLHPDIDTIDHIVFSVMKMSHRHSRFPHDATMPIMTLTNSWYLMVPSWPCHDSPWLPRVRHDPLMTDRDHLVIIMTAMPPMCTCSTHGQLCIPFRMFLLWFPFSHLFFIVLPYFSFPICLH